MAQEVTELTKDVEKMRNKKRQDEREKTELKVRLDKLTDMERTWHQEKEKLTKREYDTRIEKDKLLDRTDKKIKKMRGETDQIF